MNIFNKTYVLFSYAVYASENFPFYSDNFHSVGDIVVNMLFVCYIGTTFAKYSKWPECNLYDNVRVLLSQCCYVYQCRKTLLDLADIVNYYGESFNNL